MQDRILENSKRNKYSIKDSYFLILNKFRSSSNLWFDCKDINYERLIRYIS